MPRWLNRNIWGMTITSMLSDACYEMVLAVLPGFLPIIHVAAAALGWIEGASDAFSSFLKLFSGWYSDKLGHRKWMIVLGYLFTGTGLSIFSAAVTWIPILLGRVVSWFGKGIRGSLRDAMLSESVDPDVRGRAFGFHRAGDTVGAIIGPLAGVALLSFLPKVIPNAGADRPFRLIFLLSLIPGLAAPLVFAFLVRETRRQPRPGMKLMASIRQLPRAFRQFLMAVGLFGAGDFSPTLLTLAAATLLRSTHGPVRAAQLAALLYVLRNIVYAGASFPIGALADRVAKLPLLSGGYFCEALAAGATALLFMRNSPVFPALIAVFAVSGIFAAAKDTLEGAIPPELTDSEKRGTVYGTLGAVNGVGDLIASALTGTLWTVVSPEVAFGVAAVLMAFGVMSLLFA
ncbi:MAG TPA: MFS transporter [Bryobacteraceae bacterium]|jgi:MFS family permease|nr:MFS transporter [Bryobacteraceae bacterium]